VFLFGSRLFNDAFIGTGYKTFDRRFNAEL